METFFPHTQDIILHRHLFIEDPMNRIIFEKGGKGGVIHQVIDHDNVNTSGTFSLKPGPKDPLANPTKTIDTDTNGHEKTPFEKSFDELKGRTIHQEDPTPSIGNPIFLSPGSAR